MKKSMNPKLLLLSMLSLLIPLVQAAQTGLFDTTISSNVANSIIKGLFGATAVGPTPWRDLIILLVFFFMFIVAFSDIIAGFTAFSKPASWAIGTGLAVIAALSRVCLVIAKIFLGFAATLGVFSIVTAVISAFVVFILIHLGASGFAGWMRKRQIMIKGEQGIAEGEEGAKFIIRLGKTVTQEGAK